MATSIPEVTVIGGGIIGVCIAYELQKRGMHVLLIDRTDPGLGCSFGNSGAISPASIAPLAMPGILRSVPSMLGRKDSPLFLPWKYLPRAFPWLVQFVASARHSKVERSAAKLVQVHAKAVELHTDLASEVGASDLLLKRGHLHLYRDQKAFTQDAMSWRLRKQYGIHFDIIDREQILQLEPNISSDYRVGVFLPDQITIRNPFQYLSAILEKYLANGGQLLKADVESIKKEENGLWTLKTTDSTISSPNAVVAAGSWSRSLLAPLGIKLALEAQRGYHVQFQGGTSPVTRTVVLTDRKVFVTPMTEGLRVGGTVEIAGLKSTPTKARAEALADIAHENFKQLEQQSFSTWSGYRPCMPDSVPMIGPCQGHPGLYVATGHGHLGLTDAVGTSKRIADAIETKELI